MLLLSTINLLNISVSKKAFAASIIATGTNPSVCDQTTGSSLGVTAQRIASGDCFVKFTDTTAANTWTVPSDVGLVSYLVVGGAGGGGNGYDNGGGGGGGGGMVLTDTLTVTPGATVSVSVGAGGAGGANLRANYNGTNGTQSTFSTINALGGGQGYGSRSAPNGVGTPGSAQSTNISSATGGNGGGGGGSGGGGGGASTIGASGWSTRAGGSGIASAITGTEIIYGEGGAGAPNSATTGSAGPANLGKGGGGGGASSSSSRGGGAGGSGIVIIRYTPDTTAPTFTSSSTFSAAENIATSATAATIQVSESATVTISSGADAARFNITRSETDTAIIKFNISPDFETPADVGGNNVYEITLTATDAASNAGTQSITITVTDVVDTSSFNSLALAGSVTTANFRTAVVITANVTVASKVTFRVNGKILPRCKNKLATGSGSSFSVTCTWRPSNRGQVALTAAATPTGAGISSTTSNPVNIMVDRRTGTRVA